MFNEEQKQMLLQDPRSKDPATGDIDGFSNQIARTVPTTMFVIIVYVNLPSGSGFCRRLILPSSRYVAKIQIRYMAIGITIGFFLSTYYQTMDSAD